MLKNILISIVLILAIAGGVYYWLARSSPAPALAPETPTTQAPSFNPLNRTVPPPPPVIAKATTSDLVYSAPVVETKIPVLRHLSTTPIGGYMASTTASSTLVRYIDRGVGHVYEATNDSAVISKISNTTIPKIYESYWNRNANAGILRYLRDEGSIVNFYAEIRPVKVATTTDIVPASSDFIPYEIKGKFLSPDIKEVAVSPKHDKIFTWNIESGRGIGYISGFDESKKTRVLDTPLTQVTVDWPEENTLAITTKASGLSSGFLYLFDIKKASLTKALGGIMGLSAKVSSDAKKIIFSSSRPNSVIMSLYNVKDNLTQEIVLRTLADKCVWSKLRPQDIYCAVPTKFEAGMYPDDWYKGNVSFIDQIWHLDTTTGEVLLLANLLTLSDSLIDATDLTLDPKENFLYFVNKRDLTLWSLDLTQ